jgi:hypothetical protein
VASEVCVSFVWTGMEQGLDTVVAVSGDGKAWGIRLRLTTSSKWDSDRGFTRQCSTVNILWAVSAH